MAVGWVFFFPFFLSAIYLSRLVFSRRACWWDGFVVGGGGSFSLLFSRRGGRIGRYQIRFSAWPYESATGPAGGRRAVPALYAFAIFFIFNFF